MKNITFIKLSFVVISLKTYYIPKAFSMPKYLLLISQLYVYFSWNYNFPWSPNFYTSHHSDPANGVNLNLPFSTSEICIESPIPGFYSWVIHICPKRPPFSLNKSIRPKYVISYSLRDFSVGNSSWMWRRDLM